MSAATFALIIATSNVAAALLDEGDHTLDTRIGLEWLDMSFTIGLSYTQVSSMINGASLDGWSFATTSEFDGLMYSALGGPYTDGYSLAQYGGLYDLVHLLGATLDDYGDTSVYACTLGFVDSAGQSQAHVRQFCYFNPPYEEGRFVLPDSDTSWDLGFSHTSIFDGAYLIKTKVLPVPAAVWLFGSGLIGLIGFARRKQAYLLALPLTANILIFLFYKSPKFVSQFYRICRIFLDFAQTIGSLIGNSLKG